MRNGKIRKYTELSDKYLNDAEILLTKGDLSQTSEKLWGAFATIVKAVAAKHSKDIKTHDGVSHYLASISKELRDESLLTAGLTAHALHQNFYEDSLTVEFIRKGSKTIRLFVNRMKKRFSLN
jgi:uncharacterized protein (UPF0332 family)